MLITNELNRELQFTIGEKSQFSKTITESDINLFAGLVADFHPMHVNASFANETRAGTRLVQPALIVGLVNGVLRNNLPGANFTILRQQFEFLKPLLLGDTVTVKVEILSWSPEKRLVTMKMDCFDQNKNDLMTGETVMIHDPS